MNRNQILAAVAAAVLTWTAALGAGPQRHAVIIGINDYADTGIPDLKYAESDARQLYDALTDPKVGRFHKDNIRLLLGRQATNDNIKAALQQLSGVSKNDLVVVFFSGHGAKEGDEAFWVTQAAKAKLLSATALCNSDIRKFLNRIPSERLVVLLDCCYAASTVKKSLDDPGKLFGDFAGKGRVTIAGAADNQEALEFPDKKSGVFTYYLVQGLRGTADTNSDGVVTFEELWAYLGENVRKAAVKQGGLHDPVIITEGGVTPRFLLTWNPAAKSAADESLKVLRKLFDEAKITAEQFDMGRKALSSPALDPVVAARRDVFSELAAGRLSPKFLKSVLRDAIAQAEAAQAPQPLAGRQAGRRSTLAVVPFEVLGQVKVKDAGKILAEAMLPMFAHKFELVDQSQLRHFLDQDDLTIAGLAEIARRPKTKSLSKAVKLRAVRFLVVGTVSGRPNGSVSVTARLTDWQTGRIENGRISQIAGEDWDDLIKRLPLLTARLSGTLLDIGPGPKLELPPLPDDLDQLTARILQAQAVESELIKSLKTMTTSNPKVTFLRKNLDRLAGELGSAIQERIKSLQEADIKLAKLYKPSDPKRQAVATQIEDLKKSLVSLPPSSQRLRQVQWWLERAKATAGGAEARDELYFDVSSAYAWGGNIAAAKDAVGQIHDRYKTVQAYVSIADAQVQAGDKAGAAETLGQAKALTQDIRDDTSIGWTFQDLARAMAENGQAAAARATADQIQDKSDVAYAYFYVASVLHVAGDKTGAAETVRLVKPMIEQIDFKEGLYGSLAGVMAQLNQIEPAKAVAQKIKDKSSKASTYAEIARAQAMAGDRAGALKTFELAGEIIAEIKESGFKADALVDISANYVEANDVPGARKVLRMAEAFAREEKKDSYRFRLVARVAKAYATAGDFDVATKTAQQVQDDYWKAWALARIGRTQADAGDKNKALGTLSLAHRLAQGLKAEESRSSIGHSVCQGQAAAGAWQAAVATARAIEDPEMQAYAFSSVATAMSKLLTPEELERFARKEKFPVLRGLLYAKGACALLEQKGNTSPQSATKNE